jgi:hypothetical protein
MTSDYEQTEQIVLSLQAVWQRGIGTGRLYGKGTFYRAISSVFWHIVQDAIAFKEVADRSSYIVQGRKVGVMEICFFTFMGVRVVQLIMEWYRGLPAKHTANGIILAFTFK